MRSRHELVWLTPAGWAQAQAQAAPGAMPGDAERRLAASVARWRANDWPLVVRRRESAMTPTQLGLGLPMPPGLDGAKLRFGFTLEQTTIARWQLPITLAEAAHAAPARWQGPLQAMLTDCTRAAAALPHRAGPLAERIAPLTFRVFGSLAMQALTGLSYVRPGSDLDLLIHPRSLAELQAALLLLERHADALPLDGEIVFPDGGAVAWREFAGAGATETVLVKSGGAVRLAPRTELLAMLGPVC